MRASAMRRARLLEALLLVLAAGNARAEMRESWYQATYNHVDSGLNALIVRDDGGRDWIRVLDLKLLGLPLPALKPEWHQGEEIVPLTAIAHAQVDPIAGRVQLFDANHERAAGQPAELIVDIVVNRQSLPQPHIIRRDGGQVWLSVATAKAIRVVDVDMDMDAAMPSWVPLHTIAGENYALDEKQLQLRFTVPAERLAATRFHVGRAAPLAADELARAPLAAIIGYEASVGKGVEGDPWRSLLFDAAISGGRTSCRSRHLARNNFAWARLDSQCIVDWPDRRLALSFGDAASRNHALSGSVRYGGIRIGTDFSLQPHLQLQPLLGIEGSARLPSVLEVWVEQRLAARTEVSSGRFILDDIPALSGSGNIEAVIVDAMGRRTLLSAPFYSAPTLLRPGLRDWTLELGRLRTGFLGEDDRYGDAFGLFTWRQGLTPWWTAEVRAELSDAGWVMAASSHVKLGIHGVAELVAAHSQPQAARADSAYALGYSYQSRQWSLGARYAAYGEDYVDLAYPLAGLAPLREMQLSAGFQVGRVSWSLGGNLRQSHAHEQLKFARAGLSTRLASGYLGVSMLAPLDDRGEALYSATYTLPLGNSRSLSAWADHRGGTTDPGLRLQRSMPAGQGYGYRLAHQGAQGGGRTTLDAGYAVSNGRIDLGATITEHGTDAWLGASGALIMSEAGTFLAQDHDASFAVVTLPESGIPIYRENQRVAVTNLQGKAIIPKLRAYERNHLRVGVEELSLSTHIENASLELVPGRRQVVHAPFNATTVRPITLRLFLGGGGAVPAGAVAHLMPGGTRLPVAHEGLLYLDGIHDPGAIVIEWKGRTLCRVDGAGLPASPERMLTYETLCEDSLHEQ